MLICPCEFQNRKAYLIRFPNSKDEGKEDHLGAAKQGLLEWGFQANEIIAVESKVGLTEFGKEEVANIDRLSRNEN
jgi:hypothetical protein